MKAMMILWVNGHHGHLANSSKRIVFRGHEEVEEVEIRISKKMYKVDIVGAQIWLNCQDQGKNKINLKIITTAANRKSQKIESWILVIIRSASEGCCNIENNFLSYFSVFSYFFKSATIVSRFYVSDFFCPKCLILTILTSVHTVQFCPHCPILSTMSNSVQFRQNYPKSVQNVQFCQNCQNPSKLLALWDWNFQSCFPKHSENYVKMRMLWAELKTMFSTIKSEDPRCSSLCVSTRLFRIFKIRPWLRFWESCWLCNQYHSSI